MYFSRSSYDYMYIEERRVIAELFLVVIYVHILVTNIL